MEKIIRQIGQKVYTKKIHILYVCVFGGRIQPRALHVLEVHSTFELHSQPLGNLYYQTSLHKHQSSKKINNNNHSILGRKHCSSPVVHKLDYVLTNPKFEGVPKPNYAYLLVSIV